MKGLDSTPWPLVLAMLLSCGDGPAIHSAFRGELPMDEDAWPLESQPDSARTDVSADSDRWFEADRDGEEGLGGWDEREGPEDGGFPEPFGDAPAGGEESPLGESDASGSEEVPDPSDVPSGSGDEGGRDDPSTDPAGRDLRPADGETPPDGLRIRFVAANLTSGNNQSWDPGHGIRILQGLRGDVILVQEFNYGSNRIEDYRRFTDQVCGPSCSWSAGRGQIPNGVVSRWPIVESGSWDDPTVDNRDLDWARIDLPGPRDLVVVSVHLHTSPSSDQVRAAQVVAWKVVEHRRAHPGCCWYVVGGDFNGTAAVSAAGFGAWQGEPVFHVAPPHPVGEDGSVGTNRSRSSQYDFVLLDGDLVQHQVATCFSSDPGRESERCYPSGLVFDTRDFSQETLDVLFPPTRTSDSGAPNMQHMAVVKDVAIPGD